MFVLNIVNFVAFVILKMFDSFLYFLFSDWLVYIVIENRGCIRGCIGHAAGLEFRVFVYLDCVKILEVLK